MPMTRGLEDSTNQAARVVPEEKNMYYGIMYQGKGVYSVLKAGLTDPSGPTEDPEIYIDRSGISLLIFEVFMQIFSIYSNFLLIFEVFSADLSFFSNSIINLTYLCIFRGPALHLTYSIKNLVISNLDLLFA